MAKLNISKRNRSVAIGLIFGLLCAVCVGVYIANVDAQAKAAQSEMLAKYGGDQIDVCVAKRDIAAGETVRESDIEVKTWVATLLPADAVVDKAQAVGRRVGSTILAGEVVSNARFGFESADIDVPDGFVAVSVPAREVQAVGGALGVGMTVDVYAVGSSSTTRVASAVKVLAASTGRDSSKGSSSAWVTLAIKPECVQEIVSAAENLEIYFTLPSESAIDSDAASDSDSGGAATVSSGAHSPSAATEAAKTVESSVSARPSLGSGAAENGIPESEEG